MDRIDRVAYGMSTVAFILLSVGIASAYTSPASAYELSIYTQTPFVYWLGFTASLLLSVLLVVASSSKESLGFLLGGLSTASLVLLPIVRGYHQVGATDSMSHWGTAQQTLQAGEIVGWRYPVIHVTAAMWSLITGEETNTMIYLLAAVYALTFPLFVYLIVRRLGTDLPKAKRFGFLSALLFLPINQLGVRIEAHPTSQAVLFLPVIVFVTVLYYDNLRKRTSLLVVLLVFFYVYLHPQQAANLVLLLGLLSVGLFVLDRRVDKSVVRSNNYHHFPTLVTGVLFWALVSGRELFTNKLQNSAERFVELTGRGVETVEGRASSVDAVGGSIEEIFVKLFLIATVFCGLYVVNVLAIGWSFNRSQRKLPGFELVLTVGVLSVVGMVGIYLVGGISDQFARHLGFVMVIVTVLGSLALARLYALLEPILGTRPAQAVFILFFAISLALSVPVVHSSEYIYKGSGHVPESQVSGYDTALEYYDADRPIIYARSPAFRYATVTTDPGSGVTETLEEYHQNGTGPAPIHFDNRTIHRNAQPIYVGVVESDISRDADLYKGFKFSDGDFAYLETHSEINKVITNGQFQLYQSPGNASATTVDLSGTNTTDPSDANTSEPPDTGPSEPPDTGPSEPPDTNSPDSSDEDSSGVNSSDSSDEDSSGVNSSDSSGEDSSGTNSADPSGEDSSGTNSANSSDTNTSI